MSEDKVRTKGSCWSVWIIYDSKELSEITTTGIRVDDIKGCNKSKFLK